MGEDWIEREAQEIEDIGIRAMARIYDEEKARLAARFPRLSPKRIEAMADAYMIREGHWLPETPA